MEHLIGQKVKVYFNLHNKLWSIKHKGKVVGYASHLTAKPIKFHVGEKTRVKIDAALRETGKRDKKIHAWIDCIITSIDVEQPKIGAEISYNPYFAPFYYDRRNDKKEIDTTAYTSLYFSAETRYVYGV